MAIAWIPFKKFYIYIVLCSDVSWIFQLNRVWICLLALSFSLSAFEVAAIYTAVNEIFFFLST